MADLRLTFTRKVLTMRRVSLALAMICALAPGLTCAAEVVRTLEVVSVPLAADAGTAPARSTPGDAVTRPATAFLAAPFLTRQSATLKADGSLEMRCDGGSRRNFAKMRRSTEPGDGRPREAQP